LRSINELAAGVGGFRWRKNSLRHTAALFAPEEKATATLLCCGCVISSLWWCVYSVIQLAPLLLVEQGFSHRQAAGVDVCLQMGRQAGR